MDSPIPPPSPRLIVAPLVVSVAIVSAIVAALLIYEFITIMCFARGSAQRRHTSPFITSTLGSSPQETTKNKGISQDVLNSIPILCYSSDNGLLRKAMFGAQQTVCAVCLGELLEEELVRLLPVCGHAFHLHCIDEWFVAHSNCPICRSEMVKVDKCFMELASNYMEKVIEAGACHDLVADPPTNCTQFNSRIAVTKRCSSLLIPFDRQDCDLLSPRRLTRSLSMGAYNGNEVHHVIKSVDVEQGLVPSQCASSCSSNLWGRRSFKWLEYRKCSLVRSFSSLRTRNDASNTASNERL